MGLLGKGVRRKKNVGKIWCSNDIKLVFGPGVSKFDFAVPKITSAEAKRLRQRFCSGKIAVLGAKDFKNPKTYYYSRHLGCTR